MLRARTTTKVANLRAGIARIGRLSDNIIGIGPFGIGLDGALAWIPVIGGLYSVAAGGLLLLLGWRARVPPTTLMNALLLVAARSGIDVVPVPFAAPAVVDLFRAHKMAADMMIKGIDNTLYVEGRRHRSNPAYDEVKARVRSGEEKRRIVFLG